MKTLRTAENAIDTALYDVEVDEAHVRRVSPEIEAQIDECLGLQMISIRLEKSLIDDFKMLGSFHGVGYQPLMRDVLKNYARREKKKFPV